MSKQKKEKDIILSCPNCKTCFLVVNGIRCGLFRCAQYKTGKIVNPHISDTKLQKLIKQEKIYGCGYRFNHLQLGFPQMKSREI